MKKSPQSRNCDLCGQNYENPKEKREKKRKERRKKYPVKREEINLSLQKLHFIFPCNKLIEI